MNQRKRIRTMGILLAAAVLCWTGCSPTVQEQPKPMEIYYFYDNPCQSCDDEGKFSAFFEEQLGDIEEYHDYTLGMVNTFSDTSGALEKQLGRLGIAKEEYDDAMVMIGDSWLSGSDIMAEGKLRQMFWREGGLGNTPEVLEYYYRDDCKDCQAIDDTIRSFFEAHPEIPAVWLNTNDISNKEDFKALLAKEEVPSERIQVPYVIYKGTHYSGNAEIEAALETVFQ